MSKTTHLDQWRKNHPGPPRRPAGTLPQPTEQRHRAVVFTPGDAASTLPHQPLQIYPVGPEEAEIAKVNMGAMDLRPKRGPGLLIAIGPSLGMEEVVILSPARARELAALLIEQARKIEDQWP